MYPRNEEEEPFPAREPENPEAKMNYLRGLIMVQGTETEAVLKQLVDALNIEMKGSPTGGKLANALRSTLADHPEANCNAQLEVIDKAVRRRNRSVHDTADVAITWRNYTTGDGGDWIEVDSTLGDISWSENDLRKDLALQQEGTVAALEICRILGTR